MKTKHCPSKPSLHANKATEVRIRPQCYSNDFNVKTKSISLQIASYQGKVKHSVNCSTDLKLKSDNSKSDRTSSFNKKFAHYKNYSDRFKTLLISNINH